MNFFETKVSAEKYFNGRPDFHAGTIGRIKEYLGIKNKLASALDVACGTGLSTKALLGIADEVYGTDRSEEMLNVAVWKDKIRYIAAPAENQPFENGAFDLITVSSAVHWFNIDAFLAEVHRILKPAGWLAVYENYFPGKLNGNNAFESWVKGIYLKRFPSPPRNNSYDWSADNISAKGFNMYVPGEFENEVGFDRRQLINYLTTQSNIEAAVIGGTCSYAEAEDWLNDELSVYFENDYTQQTFIFGNRLKYLQKFVPNE